MLCGIWETPCGVLGGGGGRWGAWRRCGVENGFFCGLRRQQGRAGAASLRGAECRCCPRWGALGCWWRLCGSAEVVGGFWGGVYTPHAQNSTDDPQRRTPEGLSIYSEVGVGDAEDCADGCGGYGQR